MNELETIRSRIHEIRGARVMLDFDLAKMYGVETRVLNQAVKRNIERFPEDFMFQLTEAEWTAMSSQFVMTSRAKRPKVSLPFAFTEHGALMLASVLRSDVAINASINITRAFVAMRQALMAVALPIKLSELERAIEDLRRRVDAIMVSQDEILADQNDINESTRAQLDAISTALSELQSNGTSDKLRRRIGFIKD